MWHHTLRQHDGVGNQNSGVVTWVRSVQRDIDLVRVEYSSYILLKLIEGYSANAIRQLLIIRRMILLLKIIRPSDRD